MTSTRLTMCLAFVVVWTFAAGCGRSASNGTPGTQAASGSQAPDDSRTRAKQNACALIDQAEIEAIAGQKLTMLHDIQADDLSACELSAVTEHVTPLVTVTVHWRGGREIAQTNQTAMGLAKRLLNEDDVDIEELTGSANVKGLADKAYYSDLMPSWLLKGDVLIEVISPTFNHEKTKGVFVAVARKALSRL